MNCLRSHWKSAGLLLGICGIAVALAGCQSALQDEPTFSEVPGATEPAVAASPPAVAATPPAVAGTTNPAALAGRFRVGDMVIVTFAGLDAPNAMPNHEERVNEDGTITLQLIKSVVALGKTPGELQREIHDRYVTKYFNHLVVTVTGLDLYYHVGGEVRNAGKQAWSGEVTVTRAIQACGGFTDFANKKKVQLIRADGTMSKVNCVAALKNPQLDLKVSPGDQINIPRRWW
jgi:protein involved in polysaccharide export with SLBB domain